MRHFHRGTKLSLPERRSQVCVKKNQSRSQDIPRINSNLCFTYLEWRHWMNYTDWSKMIHWASADERLEEIDSLDWEWNFGPNARPLGVSVSRAFRSKSLSDSTFRVDMQTSPTLRACRFESWHQMSRPSWIMFQKVRVLRTLWLFPALMLSHGHLSHLNLCMQFIYTIQRLFNHSAPPWLHQYNINTISSISVDIGRSVSICELWAL